MTDHTEALARIDARLAALRAERDSSPLGRARRGPLLTYMDGVDQGRVAAARAALERSLDDLTATRFAVAGRAVLDGHDDAARDQLARLDPDEVTAIANAAETLASIAWGIARGSGDRPDRRHMD